MSDGRYCVFVYSAEDMVSDAAETIDLLCESIFISEYQRLAPLVKTKQCSATLLDELQ